MITTFTEYAGGSTTHGTLNSMWTHAVMHVLKNGAINTSRDGKVKELVGFHGVLQDIDYNFVHNGVRRVSPSYAAAELLWYLSGQSSVEMMTAYAPQYARFANDGHAYGAYGMRMGMDTDFTTPENVIEYLDINQLDLVIQLLQTKPDTRQAIISMWRPDDIEAALSGGVNDLPCTMTLQFLIRDVVVDMTDKRTEPALHCICTMRSNDLWLGMPYDVFCFSNIQRLVADALKLRAGVYIHNVGSLHAYERNWRKLEEAMSWRIAHGYGTNPLFSNNKHNWSPCFEWSEELRTALRVEHGVRNGETVDEAKQGRPWNGNTMFKDLALCAASKFCPSVFTNITSPSLRELVIRELGRKD